MEEKATALERILGGCGAAVVAFSGGVDSTLLLSIAADVIGRRVLAVTASAPVFPPGEVEGAREIARGLNVEHVVIDVDLMGIEEFRSNGPKRCYHCKKIIFSRIIEIAGEMGFDCILEASNLDDTGDYRPGFGAIRELGIRSPLIEAGLTKREIRELSRERGFPTWDKPALACLASRIPYGESITLEKLRQVRDGEDFLVSVGFRSCRLRHHGSLARIEVPPEESDRLLESPLRKRLLEHLKSLGFKYVTVDIEGYRPGSLNEVLDMGQGANIIE